MLQPLLPATHLAEHPLPARLLLRCSLHLGRLRLLLLQDGLQPPHLCSNHTRNNLHSSGAKAGQQ